MTRQSLNRQGLWPNVSAVIFDVEGTLVDAVLEVVQHEALGTCHWWMPIFARRSSIPECGGFLRDDDKPLPSFREAA
jgi:hypothetical protein